jgi:dCTP deaminase
MIWPFHKEQVKTALHDPKVRLISYGLSSFGYDVRLDDSPKDGRPVFVIFSNHHSDNIDPKKLDSERVTIPLEVKTDENGLPYVLMPAHSYGMGYTKEYFRIPRDVNVICLGKSTYARSAVFVNVTPIEAGFEGNVVIELGNHSGSPVKIYLNEGIAQFQFLRGQECEVSYADRGGKYQGQTGLQHAKV